MTHKATQTAAQTTTPTKEGENTMYRLNLNCYPAQVDKIVIYKDGEKLAEIEKLSDLLPGLDRVEALYLPEEPKTARKENLTRKDCYTLRTYAGYDTRRQWPRVSLYIPADMIGFEDLGEYVAMEHNGEKGLFVQAPFNASGGGHSAQALRAAPGAGQLDSSGGRALVARSWRL